MVEVPNRVIADPRTHYGDGRTETRWFRIQRWTGMANVLFLLFLIWLVVRLAGADREAMVGAIRSPWVWVPLTLLLINVPLHMRIGMREIIEDYVHEPRLNCFALMVNTYVALVVGLVGLISVLKIVIWG